MMGKGGATFGECAPVKLGDCWCCTPGGCACSAGDGCGGMGVSTPACPQPLTLVPTRRALASGERICCHCRTRARARAAPCTQKSTATARTCASSLPPGLAVVARVCPCASPLGCALGAALVAAFIANVALVFA